MPKRFALLVPVLPAVIGSPASAAENSALIAVTATAAAYCTLAAGKDGVDKTQFEGDSDWQPGGPQGGFHHPGLPVNVGFPVDADGVARICEVHATLASQGDQAELRAALEVLLEQKPIEQGESMIWMFGRGANARGLQFFPDTNSDEPQIRFVGAAF